MHTQTAKPEKAHELSLSDFYIGKYPVTQAIWETVMGDNLSDFKGEDRPVKSVSWDDIQKFLKKLNKLTGKAYRLPTEAEWEYAAKGGNKSKGYKYAGSDNINDVAWYDDNSGGETHPAGQKAPNELGIYDMSGNVWEWCHDWYDPNYYQDSPRENPKGPSSGTDRVLRGGSWGSSAESTYVSNRDHGSPSFGVSIYGFRLVLLL